LPRKTRLRIKIIIPFAKRSDCPRSEDEADHVALHRCGVSESKKDPAPAASIIAVPCNMQPTACNRPTDRLTTNNVANKLFLCGRGLSTRGLRRGAAFVLGHPRDYRRSLLQRFAMETRENIFVEVRKETGQSKLWQR